MNDDKRMAEIRERCEKATAGPWYHTLSKRRPKYSGICGDMDGDRSLLGWARGEMGSYPNLPNDADFAANARSDIPYLLEKITALESQLADEQKAHLITENSLNITAADKTALEAKLSEAVRWLEWLSGPKHEGECAFTDKADEGCYKCSDAQKEKWPQLMKWLHKKALRSMTPEELKSALDKTTPGEWEVGGPHPHVSVIVERFPATGLSPSGPPQEADFDAVATGLNKEDAAFIVAAKKHLPAIVNELEEAKKDTERLNYLEQIKRTFECTSEDTDWTVILPAMRAGEEYRATLRDAIDTALRGEGK